MMKSELVVKASLVRNAVSRYLLGGLELLKQMFVHRLDETHQQIRCFSMFQLAPFLP